MLTVIADGGLAMSSCCLLQTPVCCGVLRLQPDSSGGTEARTSNYLLCKDSAFLLWAAELW